MKYIPGGTVFLKLCQLSCNAGNKKAKSVNTTNELIKEFEDVVTDESNLIKVFCSQILQFYLLNKVNYIYFLSYLLKNNNFIAKFIAFLSKN